MAWLKIFTYPPEQFCQFRLQVLFIALAFNITGCRQSHDKLFTKVPASSSNINFKNILVEEDEFNVLSYPYFYNGGGCS